MSSPIGATSRFRVFVGLASGALCHTRFPTVDSPSQDTALRSSRCGFLQASLLGSSGNWNCLGDRPERVRSFSTSSPASQNEVSFPDHFCCESESCNHHRVSHSLAFTVAAIWTRAVTWASRVNNSCWSWITICSIVVVITPPQDEIPQVLLLRFTARKINKQSSSSNHRPEDSRSTRLVHSWALPASFHHATTNPSNDSRNSAFRGADNLNERQSLLRYQRCATDASLPWWNI